MKYIKTFAVILMLLFCSVVDPTACVLRSSSFPVTFACQACIIAKHYIHLNLQNTAFWSEQIGINAVSWWPAFSYVTTQYPPNIALCSHHRDPIQ
uniref:Putative secreted protein n=1 Tax=Ixodes scapularis TaxID=6945 RepID=A0A4D5REF3_IXOSC